jgi:hypothetical protein
VIESLWQYDAKDSENIQALANQQPASAFCGVISIQDKEFIKQNIYQAIDSCAHTQVR